MDGMASGLDRAAQVPCTTAGAAICRLPQNHGEVSGPFKPLAVAAISP